MKRIKHLPFYIGGLSAFAYAFAASGAMAQEPERYLCQAVGSHTPEPLGDREHHALETEVDSCRAVEGPMAGGVMTANVMWEWDGPKAKLIAISGIVRKPGATAAFHGLDGNVELIMSDGKVTGVTASGHNVIEVATGSAASLQGKTVSWTAKGTGPDTFEVTGTFQQ